MICFTGISGTPMYLINEVPLDADASWTYDDWMKVLTPLLKQNEVIQAVVSPKMFNLHAGASLPDRAVIFSGNSIDTASNNICGQSRPCEYLQGRTMCCEHGEFCIPQQGCLAL